MNPYTRQRPRSFWRAAIVDRNPFELSELWEPKFQLGKNEPIATLGSCFAQHIGQALTKHGYNWIDSEPYPVHFPEKQKTEYNYGIFSARVGNIYTASVLKQWVQWSLGIASVPDETWEHEGRFYDPFRPNIEPDGFASPEEVRRTRTFTLGNFRRMLETCSTFVFTMGLTEAWCNRENGVIYPMCPGTVAGTFDPGMHEFKNFNYIEILDALSETFDIIRTVNPSIKYLLTVSPVPLTATATDQHVLTATTYSKSVLRAVAGQLAHDFTDVDYFPSFEIISSFPFRAAFYKPNMRSVSKFGVDFVMQHFFAGFQPAANACRTIEPNLRETDSLVVRDEVCEDMLLEAFGKQSV